jgi:hypothetical protein
MSSSAGSTRLRRSLVAGGIRANPRNMTNDVVYEEMLLLHLAPDIQERLLFLDGRPASPTITERELRTIAAIVYWKEQRKLWKSLAFAGHPQTQALQRHWPNSRSAVLVS